jgi:hypothetical protein
MTQPYSKMLLNPGHRVNTFFECFRDWFSEKWYTIDGGDESTEQR